MMAREPLGVLIVDDNEYDFQSTRDLLKRAVYMSFDVEWASSYEEGLAAVTAGTCDVCFVDYDLDGRSGLDLVREAQQQGAPSPMILLRGYGGGTFDEEARQSGAADCLSKWHLTPALLERSARHAVERRRMLDVAQTCHERFRTMAENVSVIYFESDPRSQRLLYVSPAYEAMLGQSCADACASPRAWLEHVHHADRPRVIATLDESPYSDLEFRVMGADGGIRWLRRRTSAVRDAFGRVVRVVGTAEDVTALREAQRQAAATSRRETLGRLLGGVAHDFSNMLTAIVGTAELLKSALDPGDPRRSGAQEIIGSSMRAAAMTRRLLAFGRQRDFELLEVDLNALVNGIERMLSRFVGADIDLSTSLSDDAGLVIADAYQLEQVVVNLVMNARDAMPFGGRLAIATRNAVVESNGEANPDVPPGAYVVLAVTDEGTGMTESVRARIFEPFFTTKDADGGSGLGLSMVRDFVDRIGGAIVVHTELGCGSTFEAYLPRATYASRQ